MFFATKTKRFVEKTQVFIKKKTIIFWNPEKFKKTQNAANRCD